MEQEKRVQLSGQLLNAIGMDDFDKRISKFKYEHLAALYLMSLQREDGKEFYLKIKHQVETINAERLRKQKKIIVGFIANYSSTWIGEELYRMFEASSTFEPHVFLMVNYVSEDIELIKEEYNRNLVFFQSRGIDVRGTYHSEKGELMTWEEIGIKPEVCIWTTSWIEMFKGDFHLFEYGLDTVHTYLPYGVMMAENSEGKFVFSQYNKYIHNLTWRNFEESRIAVEMAGRYCFIGNSNAVYTGVPKLDSMYDSTGQEEDIWGKVLKKSRNPKAKKIIYAPHHTIGSKEPVHFSTFAENYLLMLDLARKYQDETVWIFKPHPHLGLKTIREEIFVDSQEWEAYKQKWRDLENADVMIEGKYSRLFQESDAMILDSISFLGEYLYAHRPYLFLKRDSQFFNDFGRKIVEVLYEAPGGDQNAIEEFINRVVIEGKDEKKEIRESFFTDYMDYIKINGLNASQNIYRIFEQEFNGSSHFESSGER